MITAYDYPVAGFFWSVLWFFLLFAWIVALFHVFGDIFRSKDMGGFAKAIWVIFVIFMPFLGVLVYLLARGDKMTEHAVADAKAREAVFQTQVKQAAGTSGPGDQLTQLAALRDAGAITEAEYESGKAKILA
jgi:heme exporter protein D